MYKCSGNGQKVKQKLKTVTVMKLISVANYKNVVEMNQKTKKVL